MNIKILCNLNEGVVRILLVAFNVIFSILSIALIALGVFYIEGIWWPNGFASLNFIKLPVLLIILGAVSFLMSLAGCYLSRSNNKTHLIIFSVCLILLLALEFAVAIIAFTNVNENVENNTRAIIRHEYLNTTLTQRNKFHKLESYYDCCGVDSVRDSLEDHKYCCQDVCGFDLLETTDVLSKPGCSYQIIYQIEKISLESGCFTMVYAIIQLLELATIGSLVMKY